ncbi:MAG: enoyl-CoA hydratase/isomerase family protein [Microthrixaceae bacterium]
MSTPRISVERDPAREGLVTITLDRPDKLNALDVQLHDELQSVLVDLETDVRARVVVLTGRGRAFSAGAELGSRRDGRPVGDQDRLARAHLGGRTCELLDRLPQVTVGVANGLAVGGGVLLLACCDLRLAAASAWFSVPEVELGMPLTWQGIPRLMRELGPARTREVVMLCDRFGAEEALRWGLLNQVHPDDELAAATDRVVDRLLAMDELALATTKRGCHAAAESLLPKDVAWSDAELMLLAYRQRARPD